MKQTLSTILLAGLALSGPLLAQPQFIDATAAAGLNFTITYGTFFDEVENHPEPDPERRELIKILWRNMGTGAAVGDYDNDGDLDVYLLGQLGESNKLYRNNLDSGSKTFTDVTAAPLDDTGMSRVAHFADLDNDGWLDILLLNDDQRNGDGTSDYPTSKIFRNGGDGSFTDVTPGSGFDPVGYIHSGIALADYNGDGLIDVYVSVWAGGGTGNTFPRVFPGENQLFKNLGSFLFEEVSTSMGVDGLDRDSFTAIFADFDADGDPDIHVAVDHTEDAFYTNDVSGSGTFLDADESALGLDHVGNDMGVAAADFDDDDDLDLYMTNIKDPNNDWGTSPRRNPLHVNQLTQSGSLSFVDESAARNVDRSLWGWGTDFVDVDHDGDLDLLAVNGFDVYAEDIETSNGSLPCDVCDSAAFLYINDSTGNFSRETGTGLDTTFNLGWDSRALISFDYDRDGDQDFLVTNMGAPVELIENQLIDTEGVASDHYLTVVPEPYHLAVGTRVYATVGGVEKRRDVIPGRSYMSGFPAEAHFGLGTDTQTDLRLEWADGCTTDLAAVAADQLLRVNQLLLDFTSADDLAHEEDAPVELAADGSDCHGTDLDAAIEWSEGTLGNVVGSGATFDASGRAAGDHPFFVSLGGPGGVSTNVPFTLTIEAAAPPLRSGAGPSGELYPGTVETDLTLATDEDATCRYDTVPGTSYDDMPNTFDSTGGTAHQSLVTGLEEGMSYSFYVRCTDPFTHANPDDLLITFDIPQALFWDNFETGDTSRW